MKILRKNYNLAEFKKLMKRYKSITREEIETAKRDLTVKLEGNSDFELHDDSHTIYAVVRELTGFGNMIQCRLCLSALSIERRNNNLPDLGFDSYVSGDFIQNEHCQYCVWAVGTLINGYRPQTSCIHEAQHSYDGINQASTVDELLQAYQNRAFDMEKQLELFERLYKNQKTLKP